MILAMLFELSLPSIANYFREVSTISVVRHMGSKNGTQLHSRVCEQINHSCFAKHKNYLGKLVYDLQAYIITTDTLSFDKN
ncbi:hypothetical protein E2C01_012662 [Portunus trituberculatus]|uniref:Uncharacterized protein n=1 Tax=Portunus trituberculatus TaxID=210409 RepID=A0A5B7DF79_PORTR|nr:hypothetical protein [Portunus trituberculatus]